MVKPIFDVPGLQIFETGPGQHRVVMSRGYRGRPPQDIIADRMLVEMATDDREITPRDAREAWAMLTGRARWRHDLLG